MEPTLPSASESGLGEVDNFAICVSVGTIVKKRKPQSKHTGADCYKITKYAKSHGPNQAARCFQSKYTTIRESTGRRFLK